MITQDCDPRVLLTPTEGFRSLTRARPSAPGRRLPGHIAVASQPVRPLTPAQVELIEEARIRLNQAFGPSAEIAVKTSVDPNEPEGTPITFVVARIDMEPAEAGAILDRLDDDWWLDQLPRAEGRVNISYEHRRN